MSDTLSVQHTKREPLPTSEKNTVDRAIEIETRMEEVEREIMIIDNRLDEGWLSDEGWAYFCQEREELESELYDLQREYRG